MRTGLRLTRQGWNTTPRFPVAAPRMQLVQNSGSVDDDDINDSNDDYYSLVGTHHRHHGGVVNRCLLKIREGRPVAVSV